MRSASENVQDVCRTQCGTRLLPDMLPWFGFFIIFFFIFKFSFYLSMEQFVAEEVGAEKNVSLVSIK